MTAGGLFLGRLLLAAAVMIPSLADTAAAQDISVNFGQGAGLTERVVQLIALITVLSLVSLPWLIWGQWMVVSRPMVTRAVMLQVSRYSQRS